MIRLQDLPADVAGSRSEQPSLESEQRPTPEPRQPIGSFAEAERELIARALKATEGNKVQAAALLRISRKKLYAKIEKYSL